MTKKFLIATCILCCITLLSKALHSTDYKTSATKNSEELEIIISDDPFDKMMAVIMHKRCINCHPSGDQPRQGEDSHLHYFDVARGPDGHGLPGLQCSTCHQETNNDFSGVPGAPHWHLAPKSMSWEGKSKSEIAHSILNPEMNGARSIDDIVKHLTTDSLVLWAFDPGIDAEGIEREKPPLSKEEFITAVKEWAEAGAQIPD